MQTLGHPEYGHGVLSSYASAGTYPVSMNPLVSGLNKPLLIRAYSCTIDGLPAFQSFPHAAGLSAMEQTIHLNQSFHTWLEAHAPGAYAAGRVHSITFADRVEE